MKPLELEIANLLIVINTVGGDGLQTVIVKINLKPVTEIL